MPFTGDDMRHVLDDLAKERPVFHSEADFQHALAWEVHRRRPHLAVRLEKVPPSGPASVHLDVWASDAGGALAIELKYRTKKLQTTYRRECFSTANQSARPLGRYHFLKDVRRLEKVVEGNPETVGLALLLTNDLQYWIPPATKHTIDVDFRVHEGKTIAGTLSWSSTAPWLSKSGLGLPIELQGRYAVHWRDYSVVERKGPGTFRYLLLEVMGAHTQSATGRCR